jgi:hypothetical protein
VTGWLDVHHLPTTTLRDLAGAVVGLICEVVGQHPGPRSVLDAYLETAVFGDEPHGPTHPPTSAAIADGWLWGRGSADSKVGAAIFCHITVRLAAQANNLHGRLVLLFDVDEHTGGFGGAERYFEGPNASDDVAGVLIGYPGIEHLVVGGRGVYRVKLHVHGVASHSGGRAATPNAIVKAADLVRALNEAKRLLTAMRDEEKFPTRLAPGTGDEQLVSCAETAATYWHLAEPFVASLQVAARWADEHSLMPWASGLRAVAGEASKPQGGDTVLLDLRHVPALIATFTAALAASGQGRWDNLKTLVVDVVVSQRYGEGHEPLVVVENPWTPFGDLGHLLPNVIARAAKTGEDASTALGVFTQKQVGTYRTPVAEWMHAVLRPHFADQYADDAAYDEAFDRTEVMLGLISLDVDSVRAAARPDRTWEGRSVWFGRSTWRAGGFGPGAVGAVAAELEARGSSWPPLTAGLFDRDLDRATAAVKGYAEQFQAMARSRW